MQTPLLPVILYPLLLTQIIELPLSLLFSREQKAWRRLSAVGAMNFITNPPLNLTLYLLTNLPAFENYYIPILLIGEAAIFAIEATGLKHLLDLNRRAALLMSGILNGSSFVLGSLITRFLSL